VFELVVKADVVHSLEGFVPVSFDHDRTATSLAEQQLVHRITIPQPDSAERQLCVRCKPRRDFLRYTGRRLSVVAFRSFPCL
jgi:hypothetical protein